MHRFINLNSLNHTQQDQYRDAITKAFPAIIGESSVIKNYWTKLEKYYPELQLFLISSEGELIGFINTIPFKFSKDLSRLPDRGWDWMFTKGMTDYIENLKANYLGGLQVIVRKKFQGKGYSKVVLNHAKNFILKSSYENLVISIRPIRKHNFPTMPMSEYLNIKEEHKVYDPWIRTHINGGAEVIKVCEKSMIMTGNIKFWETMLDMKISNSGQYILSGALSMITIDVEKNKGEYIEPNIWVKY